MHSTSIQQSGEQPSALTPGQVFAAAVAESGTAARVEFSNTITEQFPGFARRPRIAMRSLFKVVKTSGSEATHWFETRPSHHGAHARDDKRMPEAAFEFHVGKAVLKPTTAWVQVPEPLLADPAALASFIDFRLVVRVCTAENHTLARGPGGLLEIAGARRLPPGPDPGLPRLSRALTSHLGFMSSALRPRRHEAAVVALHTETVPSTRPAPDG
jgi:hypothetical protein